jgi:hypothetical protein
MKNPDGVPLALQILTNVVRGKGEDSRYVFTHNPSRFKLSDQPREVRPEIAVVVFPLLASGNRKGLAGKTAVDDVNRSNVLTPQCFDIGIDRNIRPMPMEYRSAKFVALAHGDDGTTHRFKRQIYASDSREKRQAPHGSHGSTSSGAGRSAMKCSKRTKTASAEGNGALPFPENFKRPCTNPMSAA